MSTRAQTLGRWVSTLGIADIPNALREKMHDHLLDTIGAAIVGDGRGPVRACSEIFDALGSTAVLINSFARHHLDAARLNAVAAHAAEIDDTEGCDHTGAVVVPSVLAAADLTDRTMVGVDRCIEAGRDGGASAILSGDDLILAMVAGYEVGRRMQNALGGYDAHNRVGWHSTATCGVFAAAAAASRILQLDPASCAAALSLAASSSSGSWAFMSDGSMAKQIHVANAAGNGLQSALLARAGMTGPTAIFEEVWGGYFTTHGSAEASPDALVSELGERWHTAHSAIKMYAACRSAHPALDGVIEAVREGSLDAATVESVTIETSPLLHRMICPEHPASVEAARMSLPVSIALILLGRPLDPDSYMSFRDEDVANVLKVVTVTVTTGLPTEQTARVTFRSAAGEYSVERNCARGNQDDPFTAAEVDAKFRRLCEPRIGTSNVEALVKYVRSLGPEPAGPLPRPWQGIGI